MRDSWGSKVQPKEVREASDESIAGVTGCKQYIPRRVAAVLLQAETAGDELSEPNQSTSLDLQRVDPFVVNKTYESIPRGRRAGSEGHWKMCEDEFQSLHIVTFPERVALSNYRLSLVQMPLSDRNI